MEHGCVRWDINSSKGTARTVTISSVQPTVSTTMARTIGGGEAPLRYLSLYFFGVCFGSAARLIAWIVPTRLVEALERTLLPGTDDDGA